MFVHRAHIRPMEMDPLHMRARRAAVQSSGRAVWPHAELQFSICRRRRIHAYPIDDVPAAAGPATCMQIAEGEGDYCSTTLRRAMHMHICVPFRSVPFLAWPGESARSVHIDPECIPCIHRYGEHARTH